ncbi:flagellar motor switch protein FliG [Halorhodospira abdelmalekii]|uniref:flagellar motor switch protein FliG n=1 Tax=Halorhodospira abdelmalekii TaxID=421629 RepID=UPI00190797D5|nr:flagellar motor switch protein FliG [Halorhodospira abdelmalekii]MBK1734853.1 flagellar motor switch protein FliG [Halorhodospira abdelmalekii]
MASSMKGPDRAAVLMLTLGEDAAAEIMRYLGPREVQKLGLGMTQVGKITREQVDEVLDAFINTAAEQTSLGIGSTEFIRSTLVKALGEEKAASIIDRIVMGGTTRGLDQLKWLDPRTIAEMIRLEHPQIIAIVVSYLEPDQAGQVLAEMPERIRHDIVMRVATLEGIQPRALQELDEIMERQFSGQQRLKSSTIGGLQSAANILNNMDSQTETAIIDSVKELDEDLAERIQELMFVFEDLKQMDDRSMQQLLRELDTGMLTLALKGASQELQTKFFNNLSRRAGEMLQEELEAMGPARLSDVEAAQKDILSTAKRLADEGTINLASGAEQYV